MAKKLWKKHHLTGDELLARIWWDWEWTLARMERERALSRG